MVEMVDPTETVLIGGRFVVCFVWICPEFQASNELRSQLIV